MVFTHEANEKAFEEATVRAKIRSLRRERVARKLLIERRRTFERRAFRLWQSREMTYLQGSNSRLSGEDKQSLEFVDLDRFENRRIRLIDHLCIHQR